MARQATYLHNAGHWSSDCPQKSAGRGGGGYGRGGSYQAQGGGGLGGSNVGGGAKSGNCYICKEPGMLKALTVVTLPLHGSEVLPCQDRQCICTMQGIGAATVLRKLAVAGAAEEAGPLELAATDEVVTEAAEALGIKLSVRWECNLQRSICVTARKPHLGERAGFGNSLCMIDRNPSSLAVSFKLCKRQSKVDESSVLQQYLGQ